MPLYGFAISVRRFARVVHIIVAVPLGAKDETLAETSGKSLCQLDSLIHIQKFNGIGIFTTTSDAISQHFPIPRNGKNTKRDLFTSVSSSRVHERDIFTRLAFGHHYGGVFMRCGSA